MNSNSIPTHRGERLEGWMYKKTKKKNDGLGAALRYFQRRWVVLYPDSCVIAYYKKRTDADKEQTVRNNMGTTVMPWAAAGIIPIDNIESVFPTHKDTRFDIAVSSNIGNKTYQWKCKTKLQRDLWVEAIALVHEQLQKSNMVVTMVDNVEDGEDGEDGEYDEDYDKQSGRSEVERDNNELNKTNETKGDDLEIAPLRPHTQSREQLHSLKVMRRKLSHRSDRASSHHSTTSSQGSRARLVIKTRQGSEVIDLLLTADRFAALRPPPSSANSSMEYANDGSGTPTMSSTVGRSLIGAYHMPHSDESAMSDSDTDDDCDTDVTDPDDDEYQTTTTTLNASSGTNGVADATSSFGVTDAMPTSKRSGTLIVNNEEIEIQERKRALRLQSTQDGDLSVNGESSSFLDLHIGWMYKMGRINKSWKKRFFVLTHGQLRYYTNSKRTELKGRMPLLSTKISIIDASVFKPPFLHCLEVSNVSRRLVLACTDIEKQEIWKRSLQKASIQRANSEMPPGLTSMGGGIEIPNANVGSGPGNNKISKSTKQRCTHLYGMHIGDENTESILEHSDFAGFIKKRGRINKTWNTRLFVLRGPLLTYYEAEEQPSLRVIQRKGAVSIANVVMTKQTKPSTEKNTNTETENSTGSHTSSVESRRLELMLKEEGRKLMLEFIDLTSLNGWYERIDKASKKQEKELTAVERSILKQHQISKAAHCAECNSTFSFIKKSYQCPACGLAFCTDHSNKRLPLPEITGTNEVTRCCNSCYKIESSKLFNRQADAKR